MERHFVYSSGLMFFPDNNGGKLQISGHKNVTVSKSVFWVSLAYFQMKYCHLNSEVKMPDPKTSESVPLILSFLLREVMKMDSIASINVLLHAQIHTLNESRI